MHKWKWQLQSGVCIISHHMFHIHVHLIKKTTTQNSACIFACETSGGGCCGADTVGGRTLPREIQRDAGVRPHSQTGCSRLSTWSCSGSADLNHRLPAMGPASAPACGLVLYALAASHPARSWQTRKHSNAFPHLRLPNPYIKPEWTPTTSRPAMHR